MNGNNLQEVENCLNKGAKVNAKDEDGAISLHYAVTENNKEIIFLLLNWNADISLQDNNGKTPLELANSLSIKDSHLGIIDLLNTHINTQEAVLSEQLESNNTNVQEFSEKKDSTTFKINYSVCNKQNLLDVIKNNQGIMVLEIDSCQSSSDFLKDDSFYGALSEAKNLFFVAINDALSTILQIQIYDETIKTKLKTIDNPLIIQYRSLSGTKVYIKETSKEVSVLDLYAEFDEHFDKVALKDSFENLKKDAPDKESLGLSIIIKALKSELIGKFNDETNRYRSLIKITFENIATKLDEEGDYDTSLIHYAVLNDNFLSTRLLSRHYEDLSTIYNKDGLGTLLGFAAEYASVNTLAALFKLQLPLPTGNISLPEKTADLLKLFTTPYLNNTPLLTAAEAGNIDAVDFFIRCGADMKYCNKSKHGAIDIAWRDKHYDIVFALLKADSDFPENLFEGLADENDSTKILQTFFEERKKLHTYNRIEA